MIMISGKRAMRVLALAALMVVAAAGPAWLKVEKPEVRVKPSAVQRELPPTQVRIGGGFWGDLSEKVRTVTLPQQWEMLEHNHHIDNFRFTAGVKKGVHLGPVFTDSDLYKWLEAACYQLAKHPEDQWLRARVEELAGLMEKSQAKDGYLNTYYQTIAPQRRFTNLWLNHELYCAGHFFEAAVAHHQATGRDDLLKTAGRYADLLTKTFGPGRNEGVPGHEEVELALVKLYVETGEVKYLGLADWFIERRGRVRHFKRQLMGDLADQSRLAARAKRMQKPYLKKSRRKSTGSYGGRVHTPVLLLPRIYNNFYSGRYFQTNKPLVRQEVAEGHAVRAMYFYTGAAAVYLETGERQLLSSLRTIWENTIKKRTYITGGMGSLPVIEGFGRDYELPHDSYTETCAAIGSFFYSWRMLLATGQPKYADQMDRVLYNAILGGMGRDGKSYFYQNPLRSEGDLSRKPWYPVACCPPNLARLFSSLERYVFTQTDDSITVQLYVSSEAEVQLKDGKVRISVETELPWKGKNFIRLDPDRPMTFTLRLRSPDWASHMNIAIDDKYLLFDSRPGVYSELTRTWKPGDLVEVDLLMRPRLIDGELNVKADRGQVHIMRGPLVYCLEDRDNPGLDVHSIVISRERGLKEDWDADKLGGVEVINARSRDGFALTAIPYFLWGNRGASQMEVWMQVK